MSLPFNLNSVLATASLVEGFDVVRNAFPTVGKYSKRVITYSDAVYEALNDVAEDYADWPEDQGFGSSDGTYMMKDFIDNVIARFAWGRLVTKFTPSLSIVEYSEAEYHNKVQRMESGI